MSQLSEIKVRGNGKLLLTGGRGPSGPEGAGISNTWSILASEWTEEPTLNQVVTGGDIYTYTYGGTNYYRLVPSPYDATEDKFYSTLVGDVLSGEVASRGRIVP
jgi:hypothetical protein